MITVLVTLDADGEYRVPAPDMSEDGAYYTDDYEDAKGTATLMYKRANLEVGGIEVVRVCEHPQGWIKDPSLFE